MAKDVFISYAQGDREWAEKICAQLEEAGIGCWTAPRDIAPGLAWPAAIAEAIRQCRAMIVVLSHHANESRQMAREVEMADSRHVPILPVRVEDVEPAGDMEYFVGNRQWADLYGGTMEQRGALLHAVASLLGQAELAKAPPVPSKVQAPTRMLKWSTYAAASVVAAAGIAAYLLRQQTPAAPTAQNVAAAPSPSPSSTPSSTPAGAIKDQPATAKAHGNFTGQWRAEVKYSWGDVRKETFQFKVDEDEVVGTASYGSTPRGILNGTINGNRISFLTKSQTALGDKTYEEKHFYKGRLNGDEIEFVLQTDSGYDSRTPEVFTATRVK